MRSFLNRAMSAARTETGAVMLETALVVLLFLLVLIATIETCIIGYMSLTVQFVASRSARFAMVSTIAAGPGRIDAVRNYAVQQAASLGLQLDPNTEIAICPIFRDPTCVSSDAGGPGDFILVRLWVPAGFLLGHLHLKLYGEALAKNEFF